MCWELKFEEVIVTLDHVTISENSGHEPDRSIDHRRPVAHVDGPFALDLHKGGPLAGKGGEGEQAVGIAPSRIRTITAARRLIRVSAMRLASTAS